MTANLHRYTPNSKFCRIYIAVNPGMDPRLTSKDEVWARLKVEHYGCEPGEEHMHWDQSPCGVDEEQEERAKWFSNWDCIKCWDIADEPAIFIDSHY